MNPSSILGITWVVFWIYWLVAAFWSKRSASFNTAGAGGRILIFILAAIVIRAGQPTTITDTSNPLYLSIGFLLVAAGLGLCIWSRLTMGRNWGMPMSQKVATELVTTGPYRFIRHPIYTGILLALLGSAFVIGPYWLILVLVVGAYFTFSAVVEERHLTATLPHDYPAYRRRTKMFIPFVI